MLSSYRSLVAYLRHIDTVHMCLVCLAHRKSYRVTVIKRDVTSINYLHLYSILNKWPNIKIWFFPFIVMQKSGLKDDENLALKSLFLRQLLTKYVSYSLFLNISFPNNLWERFGYLYNIYFSLLKKYHLLLKRNWRSCHLKLN